jgi:hypothetical protein
MLCFNAIEKIEGVGVLILRTTLERLGATRVEDG